MEGEERAFPRRGEQFCSVSHKEDAPSRRKRNTFTGLKRQKRNKLLGNRRGKEGASDGGSEEKEHFGNKFVTMRDISLS